MMRPKGKLVAKRLVRKSNPDELKRRARERTVKKLGVEEAEKVAEQWKNLQNCEKSDKKTMQDGILVAMCQQNLTNREIRSIFNVGHHRIERVRKLVKNPKLLDKKAKPPIHALSTEDINRLKEHLATWETEDGFPCSHRRPQKYFVQSGVTWKAVWKSYENYIKGMDPPERVISPRRQREYVKAIFPGLKLSKPKGDLCDRCVRIEIELLSPDITAERKKYLEDEKSVHIDDAIKQRRVQANFVKDYTGRTDPNLQIPSAYFSDTILGGDIRDCQEPKLIQVNELEDDELKDEVLFEDSDKENTGEPETGENNNLLAKAESQQNTDEKIQEEPLSTNHSTSVQLQAEDYGGGIALPHYGYRRPSADYFNSNLMTYNFVIADISAGVNNVFMYEEREQGKGADAVCSLRMRWHLRKLLSYEKIGKVPKLSLSLLDNCVGQNKSQCTMMFAALLSILLYETVALLYFLPGHTHMIPDRVVGYCKRSIKGLNLYTLDQITQQCNKVANVNTEHLRGQDYGGPFRVGWLTKLSKYFKKLPDGYTNNQFFEFRGGFCTFRKLATTQDEDAVTVRICDQTPLLKERLLRDFFGRADRKTLRMMDLTLPRNPGRTLANTKLKSLSEKYFSIPAQYLKYYPVYVPKKKKQRDEEDAKKKTWVKKLKKARVLSKKRVREKAESKPKIKRRVGRPRLEPKICTGVQSITKYFRNT